MDIGIDFRATAGYVTDPAGATYSLGEQYPVTRGGVTFGWAHDLTTGGLNEVRDRSTAHDPRFAGVIFGGGGIDRRVFRVDGFEAGTPAELRLACCDLANTSPDQRVEVLDSDGETSLAVLFTGLTAYPSQVYDATGTSRADPADWIANNLPATVTPTGTSLFVRIGATAGGGGSTVLAHARFVQDAADPDVTAPTASGWATNAAGTTIAATLSESGCVPSSGTGGFTLAGTDATVASWTISGTTLTLTLSGAVLADDTVVTVSYDDATASGPVEDAAGNPLADLAAELVENNSTAVPALTAGTASFVSSGPGGISVVATAPTGGTGSGPTYQWERSEDGGAYSDLAGETSLACDDATATTSGVLYRFRCKQTRGADTVATNAVAAQAYAGGAIEGGGNTFSRARMVNSA